MNAPFNPELDLRIERIIKAPRSAVWHAWTDPASFAQWWIPKPTICRVDAMDLVPGGALVTMMALWVEFTFQPGLLVHILLWVPITLGLTVVMLRFSKGLLLALEYRNKASEGRIKEP